MAPRWRSPTAFNRRQSRRPVVYDGLPQDSIIETDVAAVIQSTRQGVGRQIADMVRRLIAGEDLATLQVLWQPEFSQVKPPDLTPF